MLDSSNYLLTKVHANKAFPGKWIVTNVTATPDPTIPYAYDVAVTFNGGKMIKGGFYLFTIRDSTNGEFLGAGPRREPSRRRLLRVVPLGQRHQRQRLRRRAPGVSRQGVRASDHRRNGQRRQRRRWRRTGTAVHSGVFVPAIPVGGSPIFSTTTGAVTAAKKGKGQTVIKIKHKPLVKQDAPKPKHEKVVLFTSHPKGPHRS